GASDDRGPLADPPSDGLLGASDDRGPLADLPHEAAPQAQAPAATGPLPPATHPLLRARVPRWVPCPSLPPPRLTRHRVSVEGDGPLVAPVRAALVALGASTEPPFDSVVDLSGAPEAVLARLQGLSSSPPKWWLTVAEDEGAPLSAKISAGARAGLARAIRHSWPGTRVKLLCLAPGRSPDELARRIADELHTVGAVEVRYQGETRQALNYAPLPLPVANTERGALSVLLTGGTQPLIRDIACAMARARPLRIAFVGDGPIADADLDLEAERAHLAAALEATSGLARPEDVERRLRPLEQAMAARRAVLALRAAGARVEYFRADLSDSLEVTALLAEVMSGRDRLDLLLHGAGTEVASPIASLSADALRRQLATRAVSALELIEADAPFTRAVTFGNAAGLLGAPRCGGESAAGAALASLTRGRAGWLHLHLDPLLASSPLQSAQGRAALVDAALRLISADVDGEVLLAGPLPGLFPPDPHPLVDRYELVGDRVVSRKRLSLSREPWLRDHVMEGTALLPTSIGIELCLAAAHHLVPDLPWSGLRDLEAALPVPIPNEGDTELLMEAELEGPGAVRCSLWAQSMGSSAHMEHMSVTLLFGAGAPIAPLPSAFFPPEEITASQIYRPLCFGPIFQTITRTDGVSADGLLCAAEVEPAGIEEGLLALPLTQEAAFQSASLHRLVTRGELGRVDHLDAMTVLGACAPGVELTLTVRVEGDRYDMDVDGPNGPILRTRGVTIGVRKLVDAVDAFPIPAGGRPSCFS
ncbi:MAG: SDR family NAD(P)-dependent oxidoreductase, partial [Deltaproteobacteria bacterium]|nr:SDR family NAD(P)-dependent oxidoreductase [Deltaproteobacteria bacterium]